MDKPEVQIESIIIVIRTNSVCGNSDTEYATIVDESDIEDSDRKGFETEDSENNHFEVYESENEESVTSHEKLGSDNQVKIPF